MNNEKSFTLVEVLVSAAILGYALSAALISFNYHMALTQASRNVTTAVIHAEYVMEDIRNTTFSSIATNINSGNWNLLAGKTNTHRVNIACYLENSKAGTPAGLLPLPAGVGRMEKLPAYVLSYNSAGTVLAEGPGLVIFDALYGSEI